MRKHLTLLLPLLGLLLVLGTSRNANAFTLYVWQNIPPGVLQDQNGVDLPMGCFIQMIWDKDADGIDDPMEYFGGVAPIWWIAAGCPPIGGDEWVQVAGPMNVESEINVMPGYFYEENITPINPGLEEVHYPYLYTRFYTNSKAELGHCTYYGEFFLDEMDGWPLPPEEPVQAHTHIFVPEPSLFLLMGCSLIFLLLTLRRK